jgi:hypothetical protein
LKDENVKQISTAYEHTLILKKDGDVIGFGNTTGGKLNTKEKNFITPTKILSGFNVKQVFSSSSCSSFLTEDGSFFSHGKLGDFNENAIFSNKLAKYFNQVEMVEWTPEEHRLFSESFKNLIFCFVCCLKKIGESFGFKIPKYLTFMIIKFSTE